MRHRDGRALVAILPPDLQIRAHPAQGRRQHRLVGTRQGSGQAALPLRGQIRQRLAHEVRLQVGHGVDEGAGGLDRHTDRLRIRHHVQGRGEHVGEQAQTRRPVVIPRRQDDRRERGQLAQGAAHPRQRIHGRHRAVEHVA